VVQVSIKFTSIRLQNKFANGNLEAAEVNHDASRDWGGPVGFRR